MAVMAEETVIWPLYVPEGVVAGGDGDVRAGVEIGIDFGGQYIGFRGCR